jgi:hypothetical protein
MITERAIVIVALLTMAGCGGSPGGSAYQDIRSSSVGGSVSNTAGGGGTSTTTTSVPLNLALDPNAFTSLFGQGLNKITSPNSAQVGAVSQLAQSTGNTALQAQASQCAGNLQSCTITKVGQ